MAAKSGKVTSLWLYNRSAGTQKEEAPWSRKHQLKPPRGLPSPVGNATLIKIHAMWLDYAESLLTDQVPPDQRAAIVARMELVGALVTIVKAKNSSLLLKAGYIIDESASLLFLQEATPPEAAEKGADTGATQHGTPLPKSWPPLSPPSVIAVPKAHVNLLLEGVDGQQYLALGEGLARRVAMRTKSKFKPITDVY